MKPALAALFAAVVALGGCARTQEDQPGAVVTSTTYVVADPPVPETPDLDSVAQSVAAAFGGAVGVAVAGQEGVLAGGDDGAYPAWSTIKVPLAVAASRVAPVQAEQLAPAAIQLSDNAAAEALWEAVEPGDVEQVLADAGVPVAVNTAKIRPEFSVFGQTLLTAGQEATIASRLRCVSGSAEVVSLMAGVAPDQAYGLGQLPGARSKGGWGPDPAGGYQVRQLALATNSRGEDVALGITVLPASGDYATAQAMAGAVADRLLPLLDSLPTSAC